MAPTRTPMTGYERLAQADQLSDASDDEDTSHLHSASVPLHTSNGHISQPLPNSHMNSSPNSKQPRSNEYSTNNLPNRSRRGTSNSLPFDTSTNGRFNTTTGSASRRPAHNRHHSSSTATGAVADLKAINARLERWADDIATKFKRVGGNGSSRRNHRRRRHHHAGAENGNGNGDGSNSDEDEEDEDEKLEIHHSVFQPALDGPRPISAEQLAAYTRLASQNHNSSNSNGSSGARIGPAMSKREYETIVESVRVAIEQGVHPRMITQGSSGSYFARNTQGKVVGVFKPKDEEPYAAGNPKWNKWIHRNLFPCCFGRACLIPNLSYVSEAAAYTLDTQLQTYMVPYTDVVWLSSKSFHYPFWDRYAASRNRRRLHHQLPAKPGSFQVFLKGFQDANIFLRENPWPDQYYAGFRTSSGSGADGGTHRNRRKRGGWTDTCRPSSAARDEQDDEASGEEDDEEEDGNGDMTSEEAAKSRFRWNDTLKQNMREELEKLVILDYIMRNTDRGLDNWMIKVDRETNAVSIASEPLHMSLDGDNGDGSGKRRDENGEELLAPRPVDMSRSKSQETNGGDPYRAQQPMRAANRTAKRSGPRMTIGAIDNSLSWPWKHPDAWRSFPFGWLFLPVDLIGRPFSQRTRNHFLPLLTSTAWWSQTQLALRKVFQIDPDFQEKMFSRQMAVMKGQAWNVVETLKQVDHGPLELTRCAKVCVWDDLVDLPIAIPMRMTSSEMRRRRGPDGGSVPMQKQDGIQEGEEEEAEEMDIGAISASVGDGGANLAENMMGLHHPATPPLDLPHPGRFELSTDVNAETISDSPVNDSALQGLDDGMSPSPTKAAARDRPQLKGRFSYPNHMHSSSFADSSPKQERRFSFASPAGARDRRSNSLMAQQLFGPYVDDEDDDAGGDLGYAAAAGMEGARRQVIVERLEPVKARNPVFTWC